ncbi:MAG: hypothetical protein SFX18_03620 [Pirellulales bacterium]|nr:hypothetical protein [Pirellulales bacterium]
MKISRSTLCVFVCTALGMVAMGGVGQHTVAQGLSEGTPAGIESAEGGLGLPEQPIPATAIPVDPNEEGTGGRAGLPGTTAPSVPSVGEGDSNAPGSSGGPPSQVDPESGAAPGAGFGPQGIILGRGGGSGEGGTSPGGPLGSGGRASGMPGMMGAGMMGPGAYGGGMGGMGSMPGGGLGMAAPQLVIPQDREPAITGIFAVSGLTTRDAQSIGMTNITVEDWTMEDADKHTHKLKTVVYFYAAPLLSEVLLAEVRVYRMEGKVPENFDMSVLLDKAVERYNYKLKKLSELRRQAAMRPIQSMEKQLHQLEANQQECHAKLAEIKEQLNELQIAPAQVESLRNKLLEQRLTFQTDVVGLEAGRARMLEEIELQKKRAEEQGPLALQEAQIHRRVIKDKIESLEATSAALKLKAQELEKTGNISQVGLTEIEAKLKSVELEKITLQKEVLLTENRLREAQAKLEQTEQLTSWQDRLKELQIKQATTERHLQFSEEQLRKLNSPEVSEKIRLLNDLQGKSELLQSLKTDLLTKLMQFNLTAGPETVYADVQLESLEAPADVPSPPRKPGN